MEDAIEAHSAGWKFSLPLTALFLGKYLALLNNTVWSEKINSCNYAFPRCALRRQTASFSITAHRKIGPEAYVGRLDWL